MPAKKKKNVRSPRIFVTLPDKSKAPLSYALPDAKECKVQDPRHCQHAEGLRMIGYRDPVVMPGDRAEIRAIFGDFRLVFPVDISTIVTAKNFDMGKASPEGTQFVLPRPNKIVAIKRIGVRRKKRRDAGMSKERADRLFNRKPGADAGRRARFLLKVEK